MLCFALLSKINPASFIRFYLFTPQSLILLNNFFTAQITAYILLFVPFLFISKKISTDF